MAPLQPAQLSAVGTEARIGIKIFAGHEHLPAPIHVHTRNRVDHLAVARSVVFAHADQAAAPGIHHVIRVAQVVWRERFWLTAGGQGVQPLVCKIGEVQHAFVDQVAAPAILVHPRAHVPGGRQQILHLPIRCAAHNGEAALLFRAHFDPMDAFSIQRNLSQIDHTADDQV